MTRPFILFALALTALFACGAASALDAAATESLVVLEGSSTVTFVDNGGPRKAVVAVKPTAARPKQDEEPSVIEISLGEQRIRTPGEVLKAKWQRAKDPANPPQAIEFELDDTIRRPGIYTANIAPLPVSNPTERLRIQMDIKPAKLTLPPKLVVARTVIPLFNTSEIQTTLLVRESGGGASVPNLSIRQASAFSGTLPIATGVIPAAGTVAVPAGGSTQVNYSVNKGTPIGTVTGTLQFSAPELVEPVLLEYEVRTKLTSWCIPFIIFFGFFTGWLVRKRLVDLGQLGESREIATKLLAEVDKSLAELPDAEFHKKVKPLRDNLETVSQQTKTAEITKATTTLDSEWRAGIVNFNDRKAAATEKVRELQSLAGPPLPLPAVTDKQLASARAAAVQATDALALNKVTEADDILKGQQSLANDIWQLGLKWQNDMREIIQILSDSPVGLPASVQAQFVEKSKSLQIDRLKPQNTLNSPDLRRDLFVNFHIEAQDARALLKELSTRFGFEWDLIAKAVNPVLSKLEPHFDSLAQAMAAFRYDLERAVDDPALFGSALRDRLTALDVSWSTALLPTAVPVSALPALKALADARQYLPLANQLATTFGGLLGDVIPATGSGVIPWLTLSVDRQRPALLDSPRSHRTETPTPIKGLTSEKARFLRSAVLAVIFIALYWILNADKFGNSVTDVATLFIASFGLDLSVEGILKLKG